MTGALIFAVVHIKSLGDAIYNHLDDRRRERAWQIGGGTCLVE
jgi:hypothetical protein